MASLSLVLLVVTLASVSSAGDPAVCDTGFEWNQNSLGQDPCTIVSELQAWCSNDPPFQYTKVTASDQYYPPPASSSPCLCNTVVYSLLMACSSCQGGSIYSWHTWDQICTSVYVASYPNSIPNGTAVPFWAYYDITKLPNAQYNDSVAISVGRDPEAPDDPMTESVPPASSSTTDSSLSSNTQGTVIPTSSAGLPNSSGINSNTSGGTDVDVIAGGVAGSIVLLMILVAAVLCCIRRRRRQTQQLQSPPPYTGVSDPPLLSPNEAPTTSGRLTLYDPQNPSTYPPPFATYTTRSHTDIHGVYTGFPEV